MNSQHHLDGNAAAGALTEVFGCDVTEAIGTCAGCDHRAALAQMPTWMGGPGIVMRCPQCTAVLLRLVTTPVRNWLQMTGLRSLEMKVGR